MKWNKCQLLTIAIIHCGNELKQSLLYKSNGWLIPGIAESLIIVYWTRKVNLKLVPNR